MHFYSPASLQLAAISIHPFKSSSEKPEKIGKVNSQYCKRVKMYLVSAADAGNAGSKKDYITFPSVLSKGLEKELHDVS